jgi:hypothetical protein
MEWGSSKEGGEGNPAGGSSVSKPGMKVRLAARVSDRLSGLSDAPVFAGPRREPPKSYDVERSYPRPMHTTLVFHALLRHRLNYHGPPVRSADLAAWEPTTEPGGKPIPFDLAASWWATRTGMAAVEVLDYAERAAWGNRFGEWRFINTLAAAHEIVELGRKRIDPSLLDHLWTRWTGAAGGILPDLGDLAGRMSDLHLQGVTRDLLDLLHAEYRLEVETQRLLDLNTDQEYDALRHELSEHLIDGVCPSRPYGATMLPVPPVMLRGRQLIVSGQPRGPLLSQAQYEVVKALLGAGEAGLTREKLEAVSGDARGILQRLARTYLGLGAVIEFPGKGRTRYRIRACPTLSPTVPIQAA